MSRILLTLVFLVIWDSLGALASRGEKELVVYREGEGTATLKSLDICDLELNNMHLLEFPSLTRLSLPEATSLDVSKEAIMTALLPLSTISSLKVLRFGNVEIPYLDLSHFPNLLMISGKRVLSLCGGNENMIEIDCPAAAWRSFPDAAEAMRVLSIRSFCGQADSFLVRCPSLIRLSIALGNVNIGSLLNYKELMSIQGTGITAFSGLPAKLFLVNCPNAVWENFPTTDQRQLFVQFVVNRVIEETHQEPMFLDFVSNGVFYNLKLIGENFGDTDHDEPFDGPELAVEVNSDSDLDAASINSQVVENFQDNDDFSIRAWQGLKQSARYTIFANRIISPKDTDQLQRAGFTFQMMQFPNVRIVERNAFQNCRLSSIDLEGCVEIRECGFCNCTLPKITLNRCGIVRQGAFTLCHLLTQIDLPTCTLIEKSAFSGCSQLDRINIPACKKIQTAAFSDCSMLTSVVGQLIESIGGGAFANCSALLSVELYNCKKIKTRAFENCKTLSKIILATQNSLISIGDLVFNGVNTATCHLILGNTEFETVIPDNSSWNQVYWKSISLHSF
jgi:hypothetical protein